MQGGSRPDEEHPMWLHYRVLEALSLEEEGLSASGPTHMQTHNPGGCQDDRSVIIRTRDGEELACRTDSHAQETVILHFLLVL